MCEVLGASPSAYYEWVGEQEAEHERRDAELRARIQALFVQFKGRYGAPRIHGELAKEGARVSRKRVARLMRESGLRAKTARKYKATTDSNHALPVAPNPLERRFDVAAPNTAWVSDISVPQISGVKDEGRSLAIGLQEQIANHCKRLGSKALVVSVAEKVP